MNELETPCPVCRGTLHQLPNNSVCGCSDCLRVFNADNLTLFFDPHQTNDERLKETQRNIRVPVMFRTMGR